MSFYHLQLKALFFYFFQLDDIQFYALPTETSNNDTDEVSDSEPVKSEIFYRNAKCGCGYQSPSEVDISDCFSAQNRSVLNRHFGVFNVSYNLTAVHIPTDVYNQGTQLCQLSVPKHFCIPLTHYQNFTLTLCFRTGSTPRYLLRTRDDKHIT